MTAASRLDTRVVIESRSVTQDSLGGPVESWSTFATVWGEVVEMRGYEVVAGRILQTSAVRQTLLRLRYLPGVTPTMRAKFRGRTMQITNVMDIGRKKGTELVVSDMNG